MKGKYTYHTWIKWDKKVALSYLPPNLSPFSQNFWPLQNPYKAFSPPPESTNQPTAASVSSQFFGNKVSQAMNIEKCVHSKFEWLTQNELFPQHDLLKRICFRVGWWKTSIIIREGQKLIISQIRSALIVENLVYSPLCSNPFCKWFWSWVLDT